MRRQNFFKISIFLEHKTLKKYIIIASKSKYSLPLCNPILSTNSLRLPAHDFVTFTYLSSTTRHGWRGYKTAAYQLFRCNRYAVYPNTSHLKNSQISKRNNRPISGPKSQNHLSLSFSLWQSFSFPGKKFHFCSYSCRYANRLPLFSFKVFIILIIWFYMIAF